MSLLIMVPGWALLGGFARLDSEHPPNVAAGMAFGAVIGVFFGLVFGGVNWRFLDFVYGPQMNDDEGRAQESDASD